MHVFPAVLALATNFKGYATFGRLLGDSDPALLQQLNVQQARRAGGRAARLRGVGL